jgi:hypothetical protein
VGVQRAVFTGLTARTCSCHVWTLARNHRGRPSDRGGLRVPRRRENDRTFSPRVQEIHKTTDGPPGVGTIYASTVKDAGLTTHREYEITEFVAPTRIRWAERSKNLVTAPTGG